MHHIHDFLQAMVWTHILFHKPPIPKLSQLELVLTSYHIHHPNHFCCNLRLSPKTYDAILSHIEDFTQTQITINSLHCTNSLSSSGRWDTLVMWHQLPPLHSGQDAVKGQCGTVPNGIWLQLCDYTPAHLRGLPIVKLLELKCYQ